MGILIDGPRLVAILAVVVVSTSAAAQHAFDTSKVFRLERSCAATERADGSGARTPLQAGGEAIAYGLNKPEGATSVRLRIGRRDAWLPLNCGRFLESGAEARCAPFFDEIANPQLLATGRADITPPPPKLNAFDRDVAELCGAPGAPVSRDAFEELMRAHPDVLRRIRIFSGGVVSPRDRSTGEDDAYLRKLSGAWFGAKGFEHVFCGEPTAVGRTTTGATRENVGGLHFHGRYLQLQRAGLACRIANHHRNEAQEGAVYSFGVTMRNASGGVSRAPIKGYGLTLSAEDLLKIGAKANALRPEASKKPVCRLRIADDGQSFEAVFVWRKQGVRTFYPDATPDSRLRLCGDVVLP